MSQARQRSAFEVRHQVPGRVRLKVPVLSEHPELESRLTGALMSLSPVDSVRANASCGSLVIRYNGSAERLLDDVRRAFQPILGSPAEQRVARPRRRPSRAQPVPVQHHQKRNARGPERCAICRVKLRAMRWLLQDIWKCWRDDLRSRARSGLVASLAMLRS